MSANPLVAGPASTSSALSGTGVVESVADLCSALDSGSWLSVGLTGVGAVLDVAATVIDPVGSLIAAGLGWLMEHLEPLKGWLDDLTGDAGAVQGFAATWDNVAGAMGAAGDELNRLVRVDLEAMSGEAVTAYAAYADALAERIRVTGASATSIGSALRTCATVVQVVHDLVRDTLAQLVGSIISWATEAALTLGLATPVIAGQVSTRVSQLATRVGRSVTDVLTSAKSLKNLLEAMQDALRRLVRASRSQSETAVDGSQLADRLRAQPAVVQSLSEIESWLQRINPHFDPSPFSPYANNCGRCAAAVDGRLRGGDLVEAGIGTYTTPEMESITGLAQIEMTPGAIERALREGGPGSHAVVGIDRADDAGHWFNAYFDGERVVAVDGQSGEILDWPPDFGAVGWDAAIRKAN